MVDHPEIGHSYMMLNARLAKSLFVIFALTSQQTVFLISMLLKPRVKPVEIHLPKEQVVDHPAYFGTREENIEFLENNGRLLMLETMYHELSIKNNKIIHDTYNPFSCTQSWPLCNCKYAQWIREYDIFGKGRR